MHIVQYLDAGMRSTAESTTDFSGKDAPWRIHIGGKMGYTITIGELEVEKQPEDAMECSGLNFDAKGERHENAPAFGEPTDYTNSRWPSYSVWRAFMTAVGLYELFYDEGHLIGGHPGVRLVTKPMAEKVSRALSAYRVLHPDAIAELREGAPEESGWLCRLIWLEYWITWAVDNCETPVIANS